MLPVRFRPGLTGLPADVAAAWYENRETAQAALEDADVFWYDQRTSGPPEELFEAGRRLRWVHNQNVGVDRMPLATFHRRRIRFTNGAGLYAVPIAEYVVMAMLAVAKDLRTLLRAQEREEWLAAPPADGELAQTRALVIGYGQIGKAIGDRLRGFQVECVGVRSRPAPPWVVGPDGWRHRLAEFDWIIITAPLTPATRGMIGASELAAMKPGAWLINVARGAIVDRDALVSALTSGRLGGAYLDVTDPEPLAPGDALWHLPNAIVTPHSSFASHRFLARAGELFLNNLSRYRSGKPLRNLVNLRAGY